MNQKIERFNWQCIPTSTAKQQILVNNFELYKMSALAAQEGNTGKTYILHYSGSKSNTRIYNVSSGPYFRRVFPQDRKISSKPA